jgi:tetratricopeptide (TPR) repeat protein
MRVSAPAIVLCFTGLAIPATAQLRLDLASLPAGPTVERVSEDRSHYLTLVNLQPGATYRLSFGPRYPRVELLQPDARAGGQLRTWASRGGECADSKAIVLGILDATDEAVVGRGIARLESEVAACAGSNTAELARLVRRQVASPVLLDADEVDDKTRLLIERLLPTGEVGRAWTVDFEPPPARTAWEAANEVEWLVREVSLDLLEMAQFVDGRRPFDPKAADFRLTAAAPSSDAPPAFEVTASLRRGRVAHRLVLADHVWSPSDYEELARLLQKPLARLAVPEVAASRTLESLLDPHSATLERESQRISRLLENGLLDASTHEQAALVIAALALRESAGYFSDPRRLLCRITAHLAWASALRQGGTPSVDAQVAKVALLALVGRQRTALGEIARLERDTTANPALQAWLRSLRLRVTGDWRILKDPGQASLLERLEHFRALAWSLDVDQALAFSREHGRESLPDWGRRAMARGLNVEVGNVFTASATGLELIDLAETWQVARGAPLATLDRVLDTPPQRCIVRLGDGSFAPRVIDWGTWAASFQRHLMQALDRTDEHIRSRLAIPERADDFAKDADPRFSQLPLHAFVRLRRDLRKREREKEKEGKKEDRSLPDCPAAVRLLLDQPGQVAPLNWVLAANRCHGDEPAETVPKAWQWFASGVPPGTAFEATRRLALDGLDPLVRSQLGALSERAPYDFELARQALEAREGKAPSRWGLEAGLGPLLEFHLGALWYRAQASESDVQEYRRVSRPILALDADSGLAIGAYLSRHGLDDDAAAAYETAVSGARDRVAVANRCEWLVNYYLDHGREPDALRLAEEAADTFSGTGLLTLARLLERLGRLSDALSWFQKEADRYDDTRSLEEFQMRRERRAPGEGYLEPARATLRKRFPQGLERVDLRDFLAAPRKGVEILEWSLKLSSLGLDKGDVIVALDGYRTASYEQYRIVRDLSDDPQFCLVVWHGDRYVEAIGSFPRRSFGVTLRDYVAPAVY